MIKAIVLELVNLLHNRMQLLIQRVILLAHFVRGHLARIAIVSFEGHLSVLGVVD